jgi:hypothetical protein
MQGEEDFGLRTGDGRLSYGEGDLGEEVGLGLASWGGEAFGNPDEESVELLGESAQQGLLVGQGGVAS